MLTSSSTATVIGSARGNLSFASMAQDDKHPAKLALRKWLSANGVPSSYARNLGFADLERAYNDTSDVTIATMILRAEGGSAAATAANQGAQEEQELMTTQSATATGAACAAVAANDDIENAVASLVSVLANSKGKAAPLDESAVSRIVKDHLARFENTVVDLIKDHAPIKTIEIKRHDGATYKIEGKVHPKFETLLKVAASRQANGRHPNIMLSGPTGSGKTHAVAELAKALGLEFYTNGAISMDHQLVGFKDAAGNYHETALRKAFGRPAIYLFDEIDSSDNSPLLCLAGALANGGFEFPDAFVERHPDSVIIAAGNTWGNGATADFVGRNKLDGAIKSRFPVRISWDYDEALEVAISGNAAWAKRVQKARANARKAGVKVQIDPRMTQAGAAIIAAGMTEDEAAELTYLAELSADQRKMVDAA
jgi:hypothetical protein